ncbi:MAG: hypothetical protein H0U74_01640 [Bradymonadaceae bacterium]|nr:hypothetical protein [Lujinxingiaceae bacterium]
MRIVVLAPLLIAAGVALSATFVAAQETIFDPENPAYDAPAEPDAKEQGGETIFDPENPASEDIPQRPHSAEPVAFEAPSFTSARFLGSYAIALFVDTAFNGPEEDIVELTNELSLRLEFDLSLRTRAVVSGRFTHWLGGRENPAQTDLLINATDVRTHYEARLDEAYLLHRPGRWSLAIGNMRTPWGSTDLLRPGDVINPTDMGASGGAAATGALMPQLTASASYAADGWSLSALIVPFFVPNRVTVFGRDTALASSQNTMLSEQMGILTLLQRVIDPSLHGDVQPLLLATRVPSDTPRNASAGLRATTTAANTDLGLGIFYGWDRTPWIYVDEDMRELLALVVTDAQVLEDFDFMGFVRRNPSALGISNRISAKRADGEEIFFSEYRRRTTLLVDLARYMGPIGVRADIAFSPSRTLYTSGFEATRRASVFSALGLSYERLDDNDALALTVEGFWLHPFARDCAINRAFVSESDRGPEDAKLALIGDGLYGLAGALMWSVPMLDNVELQLGGLYNISNRDWLSSGALSKRWQSWLRATVGVALFGGPDPAERLSLGGLWANNDHLFFAIDGDF